MTVGTCECPIGLDGSPCAHQYFLWADNISDSLNFAPVFNEKNRQHFAKIALGSSFPLSFYEGLHGSSKETDIEFRRDDVGINETTAPSVRVSLIMRLIFSLDLSFLKKYQRIM